MIHTIKFLFCFLFRDKTSKNIYFVHQYIFETQHVRNSKIVECRGNYPASLQSFITSKLV